MILKYILFLIWGLQAVIKITATPVEDGGDANDILPTLLDRMDVMERKMIDMQKKIDHLETNEEVYLKEIEKLKQNNNELQARVGQLEKKTEYTEYTKLPTKHSKQEESEAKNAAQAYTDNIMEDVAAVKDGQDNTRRATTLGRSSRLVLAEGPVAFCATLKAVTQEAHLGVNQPITYDTMVTNVGGGFHLGHGIFTAPQSGIYLISASVMSWINTEVSSSITVNGARVANIFSRGNDGRHEQGTQVIVLQLNQGDDVSVENIDNTDTSIWGDQYTSFSGYLLYPM